MQKWSYLSEQEGDPSRIPALKLEGRAGRQGYCLWLVPHPTRGFLKPLRTRSRQEKASRGEVDTARSAITTRIKAAHTPQPRSPPEVCQGPQPAGTPVCLWAGNPACLCIKGSSPGIPPGITS